MIYKTVKGDTIKSIATKFYGDSSLWNPIYQANDISYMPYDPVPPDTTLIIPDIFKIEQKVRQQVDTGRMFVTIEGEDIEVVRGKIYTSLDTVADAWEIVLPWIPGAKESLDSKLKPFTYAKATVGIGKEALVTGLVFDVMPSLTTAGHIKGVRGFSYAKNIVDSDVKEPYEFNRVSLKEIIETQLEGYGIKVTIEDDSEELFDRVCAQPGEKIFSFLSKLVTQRGLLMTSTPKGDILVTRGVTKGSVGTLKEGESPVIDPGWSGIFSGQDRFSTYVSLGSSPGWGVKKKTITDPNVPVPRFLNVRTDETTEGNIERAVRWRRAKSIANALTIRLTVPGWNAPNGKLWTKNTIVTVESPTLFVPEGFDFLITGVEFFTSEGGNTTTLYLAPPQIYTLEDIEEPWL